MRISFDIDDQSDSPPRRPTSTPPKRRPKTPSPSVQPAHLMPWSQSPSSSTSHAAQLKAFTAAVKLASKQDPYAGKARALRDAAWAAFEESHAAVHSRVTPAALETPVLVESASFDKEKYKTRGVEKDKLIQSLTQKNDRIMALLEQSLEKWRLESEKEANDAKEAREAEELEIRAVQDQKEKEAKDREAKKQEAQKQEAQKQEAQKQEAVMRERAAQVQKEQQEKEKKEKEEASAAAALKLAQSQPVSGIQPSVIETPSKPQITTTVAPPVSKVPPGVIASEKAWDTAATYLDLIQSIKSTIKPKATSGPTANANRLARMKITQAIGQITSSREKIRDVALRVHAILNTAKSESPDVTYRYLLDCAAKAFVTQADTEVSVHRIKAIPMAQVAMMLCENHSELLAILLGRLMKRCPVVVPMYHKRLENESLDDFNKRRRLKHDRDDEWEKEEIYNERMGGMIGFYAAMTQTTTNSAFYEIDFGWQWLSRILNMNPRTITPQLLLRFLQMAGHRLLAVYKGQARKLFRYIYQSYIPKMLKVEVPTTVQLQLFFEDDDNFVKTGAMPLMAGAGLED
ncbi:hypothetical protein HDU78_008952 [Chytriomyces hyalinus]|nr:hypothetical protein HDU78_008952 [Chytriomyces hyalinus]